MCLNVIDRVDDPKGLLSVLTQRMSSKGLLLFALVLPYCDGVEYGPKLHKPHYPLTEMQGYDCGEDASIEASLT